MFSLPSVLQYLAERIQRRRLNETVDSIWPVGSGYYHGNYRSYFSLLALIWRLLLVLRRTSKSVRQIGAASNVLIISNYKCMENEEKKSGDTLTFLRFVKPG